MSEYTIIEPYVEFFEPPDSTNYLEFLERCTRVCYKSEEHIKLGSAEKLMSKVVREFEHYSVTEHYRWIVRINAHLFAEAIAATIMDINPLMAISGTDNGLIVSGNLRMWAELLKEAEGTVFTELQQKFSKNFPVFGMACDTVGILQELVEELDSNFITNNDNLTIEQMKKHMTATFKLVGDRTMSHQLVRHRLFAFSQESQRYCNYGKKGFQFIVPPSMDKFGVKQLFIVHAFATYGIYKFLLGVGVPPEDARSILPNCTKTEVVTTGTLGYWIDHIIPHRGHNKKAQWQIRDLVLQVEEVLKEKVPVLFNE